MTRAVVLTAILGGAAAAAAGVHARRRAIDPAPTAARPPATQEATAPVASRASWARVVGDVREYEASFDTDFAVVLENVLGGSAKGSLKSVGVTRASGHVIDVAIDSLGNSVLSMPDASVKKDGERLAAVEDALRGGVLVEKDGTGRISRVRLAKGAQPEVTTALRTLAEVFEWASPDGDQPAWSGEEPTEDGSAHAEYAWKDGDGGGAFTKRLRRAPAPSPGNAWTLSQVDADFTGHADRGARALIGLSGERVATRWSADGKALVARATTKVEITAAGHRVDVQAALRWSATRDDVFGPYQSLDQPPEHPRPDALSAARDAAGAVTIAEILRDLTNLGTDSGAAAKLSETLGAFLVLHPDESETVARGLLTDARGNPEARSVVVRALLKAGHPDAQRALTTIASEWNDPAARAGMLRALGRFREPTSETESFLRAQRGAADTNTAVLAEQALAGVAAAVRESDPERAAAIASEIEAKVVAEDDPERKARELQALVNSGSDRATALGASLVSSDDPRLRWAAAYALSKSADPDARAAIARMAQDDPDPLVRGLAARAVAHGS